MIADGRFDGTRSFVDGMAGVWDSETISKAMENIPKPEPHLMQAPRVALDQVEHALEVVIEQQVAADEVFPGFAEDEGSWDARQEVVKRPGMHWMRRNVAGQRRQHIDQRSTEMHADEKRALVERQIFSVTERTGKIISVSSGDPEPLMPLKLGASRQLLEVPSRESLALNAAVAPSGELPPAEGRLQPSLLHSALAQGPAPVANSAISNADEQTLPPPTVKKAQIPGAREELVCFIFGPLGVSAHLFFARLQGFLRNGFFGVFS